MVKVYVERLITAPSEIHDPANQRRTL